MIEFILGLYSDHQCNHIWSLLVKLLQLYVVHPYILGVHGRVRTVQWSDDL